jgi:hypothetical protein
MRRGNVLVKQMLIQETGSYHPIVHRPINPVMEHSTIEAIAGRAMESTAQGADITGEKEEKPKKRGRKKKEQIKEIAEEVKAFDEFA